MKIAIAGASGLIGSHLVPALRTSGHEVLRLVRRPAAISDEIAWEPETGAIDETALRGVDAVVNLAGENVAAGRWTTARREAILRSRIASTRTLVRAMRKRERGPAVLINASAVGIYGSRGDEVLTEASREGAGFLPEVCRAWESEADAATQLGVRVVVMRFGVVLAREGGALAKMLPVFRLGLGGRLGSGRQWMSWVSIEDVARAIMHVMVDRRGDGAVNVAAPEPATNAEFTRVLARVLRRPAAMRVPRWALRGVFGVMAEETLLASQRAVPQRLLEMGFAFRHFTLDEALRAVLK